MADKSLIQRIGEMAATGLALAGIVAGSLFTGGCPNQPKDKLVRYENFQGKKYEVYEDRKPNTKGFGGIVPFYINLANKILTPGCPKSIVIYTDEFKKFKDSEPYGHMYEEKFVKEARIYPDPNNRIYIKFDTLKQAAQYWDEHYGNRDNPFVSPDPSEWRSR